MPAAVWWKSRRKAWLIPSIPRRRATRSMQVILPPGSAARLARALVAGGLPVIEITLRTEAAVEAARAIIAEVPGAVVGVGTVLTPKDLDQAARIGAAFAISPGMSHDLLDAAASGDLPFAPGIQTAS